jgi:hypothetical protein
MNDECMRFGRKRSWPCRGTYPAPSRRSWGIPREDIRCPDRAPPACTPRALLLGVLQLYNGHPTTAVCRACEWSGHSSVPGVQKGASYCRVSLTTGYRTIVSIRDMFLLLSDANRSPCRVALTVLVGSAWPYPYLRLMNVPQLLAYLVANCGLAAWSYSVGECVNTAIWGKPSASRYTKIFASYFTNLSRIHDFLVFFLFSLKPSVSPVADTPGLENGRTIFHMSSHVSSYFCYVFYFTETYSYWLSINCWFPYSFVHSFPSKAYVFLKECFLSNGSSLLI